MPKYALINVLAAGMNFIDLGQAQSKESFEGARLIMAEAKQ